MELSTSKTFFKANTPKNTMQPTYTTLKAILTNEQAKQITQILDTGDMYHFTRLKEAENNTHILTLQCLTADAPTWREILITFKAHTL